MSELNRLIDHVIISHQINLRLDRVPQLRESCQSLTQGSRRSIIAYEAKQAILKLCRIVEEQGMEGIIEALFCHQVDASVVIVETVETGLNRDGHHFPVLFALPVTRGYNFFIDRV
jgi:hypothetical protein